MTTAARNYARRAVLALTAALMLGPLIPSGSASAQDVPSASAFERLAACAQREQALHVQLVLDESGSLEQTDSDALRVRAAETALRQLARVDVRGIDVDVRVAGFSADYTARGPWSRASDDHMRALLDQVRGFAQRTDGIDTDFANALAGARTAFADNAGTEATPCRLLLLFTDGDYDIEPRDSTERRQRYGATKPYAPDVPLDDADATVAVVRAGRRAVCTEGGLAEQLRDSDVVTFVVALTDSISADDERFLRGVTGEGGCGSEARPELGAFFSASDPSSLIEAFDRIGTAGDGTVVDADNPYEVCVGAPDAGCAFEFTVDRTVSDAHLLVHLDQPDVVATLSAPNGDVATIGRDRGFVRVAGVPLQIRQLSDVDVTVDAAFPTDDAAWTGTWRVVFAGPGGSAAPAPRVQLMLFGSLRPRYVGDTDVRTDGTLEIVAESDVAPAASAATDDLDVELTAAVSDPVSGRTTPVQLDGPDAEGRYRGSWTPPDDLESAQVDVRVDLNSRTPAGVTLQPSSVTVPIEVLPPAEYPRVAATELRLTPMDDDQPATGQLTIEGGETSGGCVWVAGVADADLPRLASGLHSNFTPDATSGETCQPVRADLQAQIDVALTADEITNGRAGATIELALRSDEAGPVLGQKARVTFEMIDTVDATERNLIFWGLLIPGLLLPFIVLWLLNLRDARFRPTIDLQRVRISIRVTADARIERLSGGPLNLTYHDVTQSGDITKPTRSATVDGLSLRSRTPLWPLRRPFGLVTHPAYPVTGPDGTARIDGDIAARTGFVLTRTWWFVLNDIQPATPAEDDDVAAIGELVLFIADDRPVHDQAPDLELRIDRELPPRALELARHEAEQRRADVPEADLPEDDDPPWTRPGTPSTPGSLQPSPSGPFDEDDARWTPPGRT